MFFHYTAKSSAGVTSSGVLEADSLAAVRQLLREKGLFALALNPEPQALTASGSSSSRLLLRTGISKRDILMLTSQLVIMTRSGVELAEALQICRDQCAIPALRKSLEQIYSDLSDGLSVSSALKRQTHVFGEAYAASVAAGEASGQITEVLVRMADMLRNEIRLQSTLRGALSYPIVLMSVSLLVVAALVGFVLPQFSQIFSEMEIPTPASTQILLDLSALLRHHGWWCGLGLIAAVVGGIKLWSTQPIRRFRDGMTLNTIVVRDVTRSLFIGRTFRLLGTMLQSGVPLLDALSLCRSTLKNSRYHELFDSLQTEVLNGRGIGQALVATPFVPGSAAQMVLTAERAGKLGNVMQMVGEFYEDDGERRLQEFAKLLEPAIIVIMGAVVAFIVASVMLPMLDISTVH